MVEVGYADGAVDLSQVTTKAVQEYIKARKSAPTFKDEMAAARPRQEQAAGEQLVKQHAAHENAPRDIV